MLLFVTDRLMQLLPFLSSHFSFIFFASFFVRSQISFLASLYLHCWRTFFSFFLFLFLLLIDASLSVTLLTRVRSLPNRSFITQLFTQPFVTHIRKRVFSFEGGFGKKRNFEVGWSWVYLSSFSSFSSSKYIAMSLSAEAQILYNTSIVLGV